MRTTRIGIDSSPGCGTSVFFDLAARQGRAGAAGRHRDGG